MFTDTYFLIFAIISCIFGFAYVYIVMKYLTTWVKLPDWSLPFDYAPSTTISIVVPARNEEQNIIKCLKSLSQLNYPKRLFEVIIVDDHSEDNTFLLSQEFSKDQTNFKCLKLADFLQNKQTGSFKKKAIETAILQSQHELIVTTDADCLVPSDWLRLLASFCEHHQMELIAAPVSFYQEKTMFERFQSLDFLGMMGATAANLQLGWTYMCNGANLAYTKRAFVEVNGFSGIDHIASGDDMLLMQKIAAHFPKKIGFLKSKEATVLTQAKTDISSFFSQRLRWATKASGYFSLKTTAILVITFLFCTFIITSLISTVVWGWPALFLLAFLLLIKSISDFYYLRELSKYFLRADLMQSFWISQLFHILYITSIGFWSNICKQYRWKGRSVK